MHRFRHRALRVGDVYYDTKAPCHNGHLSPRYSLSGACRDCRTDASRRYVKLTLAAQKAVGLKHPESERNMHRNKKDALAAGESMYKTGGACVYGHYAPRYTKSGNCTECVAGRGKQRARLAIAAMAGWPEATLKCPPEYMACLRACAEILGGEPRGAEELVLATRDISGETEAPCQPTDTAPHNSPSATPRPGLPRSSPAALASVAAFLKQTRPSNFDEVMAAHGSGGPRMLLTYEAWQMLSPERQAVTPCEAPPAVPYTTWLALPAAHQAVTPHDPPEPAASAPLMSYAMWAKLPPAFQAVTPHASALAPD